MTGDHFPPAADVKLFIDPLDVGSHGGNFDLQLVGDFFVGQPRYQVFEDLLLPGPQTGILNRCTAAEGQAGMS